MPKGEKNKLTIEQRDEIITLQGKESGHKVAERFGVSHTAIYKLWRKKGNLKKPQSIDTAILKALVPIFVEKELKVDLTVEMVARVKELFEEVSA